MHKITIALIAGILIGIVIGGNCSVTAQTRSEYMGKGDAYLELSNKAVMAAYQQAFATQALAAYTAAIAEK